MVVRFLPALRTRAQVTAVETNDRPVVLLIEDHADSRELYVQMFHAYGFAVIEAADGAHALADASACAPSIVVTDMRMPGSVSAAEVCRHFAAVKVPVVVITGVRPGPEQDAVRDAGCALLMMKPLSPDALLTEVRRILAGTQQALRSEQQSDAYPSAHSART